MYSRVPPIRLHKKRLNQQYHTPKSLYDGLAIYNSLCKLKLLQVSGQCTMTQGGQSWAESAIHRNIGTGWSSWRGSRKSGTYWQRPRPGSPRRRRGPQAGLRVHEGASGRVQHSRHVSSAASLPQRILCVAEASPVALGRVGSGAAGAHSPDPRRVAGCEATLELAVVRRH